MDRPLFIPGSAAETVKSFQVAAWGGVRSGNTKIDSSNKTHAFMRVPILDLDAFEYATTSIINKYSILSYCFEERKLIPWLVPAKNSGNNIINVDFSHFSLSNARAKAIEYLSEIVWTRFDVYRGPLFRAFTLKVHQDECYIGIVVHHLVCDNSSIKILTNDLLREYSSKLMGSQKCAFSTVLSFQDYLQNIADWIDTPRGRDISRDYFGSITHLNRTDFGSLLVKGEFQRVNFLIDEIFSNEIRTTARRLNVSTFCVLAAAQKILLSYFQGMGKISLKIITSGREISTLRGVVGNLADRVYITSVLSSNMMLSDCVKLTFSSMRDAQSHAFIRYDFVQNFLDNCGLSGAAPVFNFTQNAGYRRQQESKEIISQQASLRVPAAPDVAVTHPKDVYYLEMHDTGRELLGTFRWGDGRIIGLDEGLKLTLREISKNSDQNLSELLIKLNGHFSKYSAIHI